MLISKKRMLYLALATATCGYININADTSTLKFENNSDETVFASMVEKGDATILQKNLENGRIEIAPHRSYDLIRVNRGQGSSEDIYKIAITNKDDMVIAVLTEKVAHEFLDSDVFAAIVPQGANPEWAEFDTNNDTSKKQVIIGYTTYTIDQSFSGDDAVFKLSAKTIQFGEACTTKSNRPGILTAKGCVHSCKTEFGVNGLLGSLKDPNNPNKKQCFPYTQQQDEKTNATTEGFLDVNDEFLPLCRTASSDLGFMNDQGICQPYCTTQYGENGIVSTDGKTCTPFGGKVVEPTQTTPAAATPAPKPTSSKKSPKKGAKGRKR